MKTMQASVVQVYRKLFIVYKSHILNQDLIITHHVLIGGDAPEK